MNLENTQIPAGLLIWQDCVNLYRKKGNVILRSYSVITIFDFVITAKP